jgi:hypothetical protein
VLRPRGGGYNENPYSHQKIKKPWVDIEFFQWWKNECHQRNIINAQKTKTNAQTTPQTSPKAVFFLFVFLSKMADSLDLLKKVSFPLVGWSKGSKGRALALSLFLTWVRR